MKRLFPRSITIALVLIIAGCGGDDSNSDVIVARAERLTVDLASLIDESPGIAGTFRYGCSADPALQVAQTTLTAPAATSARDTAGEMISFLESRAFETTLVNGEVGTDDVVLRASDLDLTIDIHFSADATVITVTTGCLRSG